MRADRRRNGADARHVSPTAITISSARIVGVVENDGAIIDGSRISPGDAIVGLASTGLHTNGYSLARRILFAQMRARPDDYASELGCTFGDELLKVHRNYWPIIKQSTVRGPRSAMHCTVSPTSPAAGSTTTSRACRQRTARRLSVAGRGRSCRSSAVAVGRRRSDEEMYRVFNMGIGMTLIVDAKSVAAIQKVASRAGVKSYLIGEIQKAHTKWLLNDFANCSDPQLRVQEPQRRAVAIEQPG